MTARALTPATLVVVLGLAVTSSHAGAASAAPKSAGTSGASGEQVFLEEDEEDEREPVTLEEDTPTEEPSKTTSHEREHTVPAPLQAPRASVWLQLGLVEDAVYVSGSDVCSMSSQLSGNFTCVRSSGSQYHGTPLRGSGGSASSPTLATTRLAISVALPLGGPWSAGARVAYAIAGQGPQPDGGKRFLPLQLEVQGEYWLTGRAFATDGVGAFLLVSGGLAQIDGKTEVTIQENTTAPRPANQLDNPEFQKLDAWRKSGAGFAGAGAGVFVPFGTGSGALVDLRLGYLFPTPGAALSLGLSFALGL